MTSLVIYAQCEQKIGLQYARKVYLITASADMLQAHQAQAQWWRHRHWGWHRHWWRGHWWGWRGHRWETDHAKNELKVYSIHFFMFYYAIVIYGGKPYYYDIGTP